MFGGIFFARSKALLGVYPGIIRGIPQHGGIPSNWFRYSIINIYIVKGINIGLYFFYENMVLYFGIIGIYPPTGYTS